MSDFRQHSRARPVILRDMDFEHCYRAVQSRDERFDGMFYTAVTSTGIYCRPSCPAITPRRENVRFYTTSAAAQQAGFRACKRCMPGAAPGSPEWNVRGDLVGRAMRMITDGIIEREGVPGLARRLGYSDRHLHRTMVAELGVGPLAIAVAQRAHGARVLLETTDMPATEVAFAAGFGSIRQFNATMQEVFAASPSELRQRRAARRTTTAGPITLRLSYRPPIDATALFEFLATRAVPGVEEWTGRSFRRSIPLHYGPAIVELSPADGHIGATIVLEDPRDLAGAVQRVRRLLDLDADPVAVTESLGSDPLIGHLVREAPGRRVPGAADTTELAIRAVLGQQISVAAARTSAGRLVDLLGQPLRQPFGRVTHLFPDAAAIAAADLTDLRIPGARKATLLALARALASGSVDLSPGADRQAARGALLGIPGIGAWTAGYILMRGLGDPDVFLPTDIGVRRAIRGLAGSDRPGDVSALAERWRPWRAYALMHLWASEASPTTSHRPASAGSSGRTR